jgi:predicted DCC family thiol-disulfide oxidoreductase YuxK
VGWTLAVPANYIFSLSVQLLKRLHELNCGVEKQVNWKLKLLFDGNCPFCAMEARWMQRRNKHGNLAFEDIAQAGFDASRYGLTQDDVMGVMHGIFPDGRIVTKVEVFRQAYRLIDLGWLLAPTRWPLLRTIFNWGYELFARYRVPLGRSFGGQRCENGSCASGAKLGR